MLILIQLKFKEITNFMQSLQKQQMVQQLMIRQNVQIIWLVAERTFRYHKASVGLIQQQNGIITIVLIGDQV